MGGVPNAAVQDYRPSAKLVLTLRIDELGASRTIQDAPVVRTTDIRGTSDPRSPLVSQKDTSIPGVTRYKLVQRGAPVSPQIAAKSSSDGYTHAVVVIPHQAVWEQNGLRTPDTLNATIRWIDMPIDPRVVRAVGVEFYLGCVSPADYADAIAGGTRTVRGAGGTITESLAVVPDQFVDELGQQRSNLRFQGFADDWECDFPGDASSMIKLVCRDNTALLLSIEAPRNFGLDPARCERLSTSGGESAVPVRNGAHALRGMTVEYQPQRPIGAGGKVITDPIPKLGAVMGQGTHRAGQPPTPSKTGGATAEKHTVLDYLTDQLGVIGHVVQVRGTRIILRTVRSFTTKEFTKREDDPFQGRTLPDQQVIKYRQMIMGRNVKKAKVKRSFTGHQPANVQVICYLPESKGKLVACFPTTKDRIKYALPGGGTSEQKWVNYFVTGVTSQAQMQVVAQSYYESLGRNELHVQVDTRNLASYGGGGDDPDLLDMRDGDTFELLVSRDPESPADVNKIESAQSQTEACAKGLTDLGFPQDFAMTYARAYVASGFITQFRLRAMTIAWHTANGVDVQMKGMNYIEVRADKSAAAGEEPGTTKATKANAGTTATNRRAVGGNS